MEFPETAVWPSGEEKTPVTSSKALSGFSSGPYRPFYRVGIACKKVVY